MQILGKSYSPGIDELKKQVESAGSRPIYFYSMGDCPPKAMLQHARAYTCVCTDQVAIFLRNDVSEIDVAHELVEAQLDIEGFPRLGVPRKYSDIFNFAQLLGSTLGHIEVNRRLKANGFDVRRTNEKSIQELLESGNKAAPHNSTTDKSKIIVAALGYVDKYYRHDYPAQFDDINKLYERKFSEARNLALDIIKVIDSKGYRNPTSAASMVAEVLKLLGLNQVVRTVDSGAGGIKSYREWYESMSDC